MVGISGSSAEPAAKNAATWAVLQSPVSAAASTGWGSVDLLVRAVLLLLTVALALVSGTLTGILPWLLGLAALVVLFRLASRWWPAADVGIGLEVLVVCLAVIHTGWGDSPVVAYLPAPVFAAGLAARNRGAALTTAFASMILLFGAPLLDVGGPTSRGASPAIFEWILLALALGMFAAFSQRLTTQPLLTPAQEGYAQAYRLLGQLRSLTRRMPGALDLQVTAEDLLTRSQELSGAERAAVFTYSPAGHLVPRAVRGMSRVPWPDPASQQGPLAAALATRSPVLDIRRPDASGRRTGSALLVCPMLAEQQVVGVLALESATLDAFDEDVLAALVELAGEEAVRLEAAVLFEELAASTTLEARERLAGEMHDGVAQELASFGYELDGLKAELTASPELAKRVGDLRGVLTQLMSDLRLSITDLRSSVDPGRGLGTALTRYVRAAGSGSALTVHLSLQETGFRLPSDVEVHLLRIAHEAIHALRRRSNAQNLWVSLTVEPPHAQLIVEHDGDTAGPGEVWSTRTLALVEERVRAVRGSLAITRRALQGEAIIVRVGADVRPDADPSPAGAEVAGQDDRSREGGATSPKTASPPLVAP